MTVEQCADFKLSQTRLCEAKTKLDHAKATHAKAKREAIGLGRRVREEQDEYFAAAEERACWMYISYAFLQANIDAAERYIELNTTQRANRYDSHISAKVSRIWERCKSRYTSGLDLTLVRSIYDAARSQQIDEGCYRATGDT
jgi:hypothetical protein